MKKLFAILLSLLLTSCATVKYLHQMSCDGKAISDKIVAYYKGNMEGMLKQFPVFSNSSAVTNKPGLIKDLLKQNIFSPDEIEKIKKYNFTEYCVMKSRSYSRRYDLSIKYMTGASMYYRYNHKGETIAEEDFGRETDKSDDLSKDIKQMWLCQNGVSPQESIYAASRVFNTIKIVGKRKKEVFSLLGRDSVDRPEFCGLAFWPAEGNVEVYMFSVGTYGWQFNVYFDENDICTEVKRMWIH